MIGSLKSCCQFYILKSHVYYRLSLLIFSRGNPMISGSPGFTLFVEFSVGWWHIIIVASFFPLPYGHFKISSMVSGGVKVWGSNKGRSPRCFFLGQALSEEQRKAHELQESHSPPAPGPGVVLRCVKLSLWLWNLSSLHFETIHVLVLSCKLVMHQVALEEENRAQVAWSQKIFRIFCSSGSAWRVWCWVFCFGPVATFCSWALWFLLKPLLVLVWGLLLFLKVPPVGRQFCHMKSDDWKCIWLTHKLGRQSAGKGCLQGDGFCWFCRVFWMQWGQPVRKDAAPCFCFSVRGFWEQCHAMPNEHRGRRVLLVRNFDHHPCLHF